MRKELTRCIFCRYATDEELADNKVTKYNLEGTERKAIQYVKETMKYRKSYYL